MPEDVPNTVTEVRKVRGNNRKRNHSCIAFRVNRRDMAVVSNEVRGFGGGVVYELRRRLSGVVGGSYDEGGVSGEECVLVVRGVGVVRSVG